MVLIECKSFHFANTAIKYIMYIQNIQHKYFQILEHCWLWLLGWAEMSGLHHHVGEGGGGQGHSEVELAKEGGHPAPRHQPPVRVLY